MDQIRRKWLNALVVCLLVLLLPCGTAFAENDNGNNGNGNGNSSDGSDSADGTPPADPGVGNSQTVIRTESAMWVLPHGDTFFIAGREVNIITDWDMLEASATSDKRGNGPVYFLGIEGLTESASACEDGNCIHQCGSGGGIGTCFALDGEDEEESCNGNGNGNGCGSSGNGNGNGPMRPADCGGAWVIPGTITANGRQVAPTNAVVIGQDPVDNGVIVEWTVQIEPTTVVYEDWQLIGHRHVACVEGNLDLNGNGNIYDPGDEACPHGWHEIIQHVWGCVEEYEYFREDIGDLNAEISLTAASRNWIQGELAVSYPGAALINPDWSFSTTPACTWMGDICFWQFTANIPVTDPGWYDIKVVGATAGTHAYNPRGFEIKAGELGVYLLDNSMNGGVIPVTP